MVVLFIFGHYFPQIMINVVRIDVSSAYIFCDIKFFDGIRLVTCLIAVCVGERLADDGDLADAVAATEAPDNGDSD